ncbi:SIS domain-containing protein [Clostridium tertium]|uniref:HTH-type transcriptional regulator MurR n=1 Tax=Clostridium tertium TaxID=1559 RepID=A0A6N3GRM0_9CLOT
MSVSLVKDRSELTKSENKICDYIEEYMNNSIYMTVTEIANGCGVGEATVTRFCRKLGFRSFLEFKMTMAQEFKNNSSNDGLLVEDGILEQDGVESIARGLYETNINLLDNCVKSLDYNQIDEITEKIINSNKVYFVGVGHSGLIAETSYYKFMRCGIECNFYRDSYNFSVMAPLMKEGDIIFVISSTGNNVEINSAIEAAKANGVIIISLTSNFISKLGRNSDYVLSYMNKEKQTPTGSLNLEVQQTFIIDLIYNNVLRQNFDYTMTNKKK